MHPGDVRRLREFPEHLRLKLQLRAELEVHNLDHVADFRREEVRNTYTAQMSNARNSTVSIAHFSISTPRAVLLAVLLVLGGFLGLLQHHVKLPKHRLFDVRLVVRNGISTARHARSARAGAE